MKIRQNEQTTGCRLWSGVILAILLLVAPLGPGRAAGAGAPAAPQQAALPGGLSAGDWASMQDLMEAAQYQVTWQVQDGEWAYRAPNPAHGLRLAFAADGLTATGYGDEGEPSWDLSLSLVAYGGQTFPAAIARSGLRGSRERVEYHWSRDVVEWYVNGAEGVEHGLTLAAPPAGADGSPVELTFALRGSLAPELYGGRRALRLKDGSSTVLRYDQLAVYDATGRSLPAHMRLAGCAPGRQPADCTLQLVIDVASAAYPLTVDPLLHRQTAKLAASDAAHYDYFGQSVAVSGDTVVVGANGEDGAGLDRGAAYVFARNQGGADSWGEVQKLAASDAEDGDAFGCSVAISGDAVVVGAYTEDGAGIARGAAYVFERNRSGADNWGQVKKLTASDAGDMDYFGWSVAISGDTVVVGADGEDGAGSNRGAAYVFARNRGGADNWGEVTKLTASAENNACFGTSVAISGDTVVVGAYFEDGAGSDRGAAYVFERNRGGPDSWGEVAKLTASDAEDDDFFGHSVSISGDTVVVGAGGEDGAGFNRGAAYVFERNRGGADTWGEVQKLTASGAEDWDYFGWSVAISGDTVVVGAYTEDGAGSNRGAAYVFTAGGVWREAAIAHASDAQVGDRFATAVSISEDTLVVGASYEDGGVGDPLSNAGAAYVFTRNQGGADQWGQVRILRASDAQAGDYFGHSVSISGDTLVVGAQSEDGGAGDPLSNVGAAYVFARNQGGADQWGQVHILRASDRQAQDQFGESVSISGDTLVVGAQSEDGGAGDPLSGAGAAYVFARNQGGADQWGQVRILSASDAQAYDYFGTSVSISGDTLVVGAQLEDGGAGDPFSNAGAAYVFARNQGGADQWGQVRVLRASDRQAQDQFGHSVSISGDTLVVGAFEEDGGAGNPLSEAGAAYVFARNQGGADHWVEVAILRASDRQADDHFGISVSISGDTLVVGAQLEDGGAGDPLSNAGAAYVFERNQGGADQWGEVHVLRGSDGQAEDWFGKSVSISGSSVVVGAHYESGGPGDPTSYAGAAYIFRLEAHHQVYLPLVLRNHTTAARYAVVVGIADYPGTENDLYYTDDDAIEFRQALLDEGGFQAENITMLQDDAATKLAIQSAITNWLASREETDDLVILFYAGHGTYGTDTSGDESDGYDEYLVPYDAGGSPSTYIRDDELDTWLDSLDSDHVVVIVDACHSGGLIGAAGRTTQEQARCRCLPSVDGAVRESTVLGDGFANDVDQSGRLILAASREDQLSWEFSALQHGVFTYHLLQGLYTTAADTHDGNGWVSGEEAYDYLIPHVDVYVYSRTGYHQNPQRSDGIAGEVDLTQP
jgi:hypothetical protein